MPKYDYACRGCEEVFTESRRISDRKTPTEKPCAECGGELYIRLGTVDTVSGVSVTDKRPAGWRDVLQKVHKSAGRTSTVNT